MNDPLHFNRCIAVTINPASGKGRAVKTGHWLGAQLKELNIKHELFTNEWPQHFDGFTEVWIVGGDGTVNYFLNRYGILDLPLAIFKGGTGNDFAWKLYGNMPVQQQLELVLSTTAKRVDAASCNGQFYVNSLGIGFDGEVLQSMGTIRWMGGHLGYLWVVIRKIFSFREFRFTITTQENQTTGKYLLVIINNSSRTGGGFMVAPGASVDDGLLDMVLCKPLSLFKRLRYLPVIEKGKHLDLPFIDFRGATEVRIEPEKKLFAQMDGELIKATVFEIKVLPGRLLVKY
jgi:YegS/Rv2252/BmrU family lipid kinase